MTNRILHIVPSLGYVSGISKTLMNYYELIDKDMFQFDFMYINETDDNYEDVIKKMGGNCFHIRNIKNFFKFRKYIKDFSLAHKNEYSIIHLHMPFLFVLFYPLKKMLNAKIVLHAHSTKYGDTNFTNIRNKILYKMYLRKADCFFACSKLAGESLFKKDFIENGFVMYNITNIKELEKKIDKRIAKSNLNLTDCFVIGHVGIFRYPKNHRFIIDIFEKLLLLKPNSKLLLVGDGDLKKDIEQYAKNKNIYESILFAGAVNDVYKYYSAMDVFVFPSIFEGFAMALVEAQGFSIPCVASNIMIPEVNINKENNVFLSLDDTADKWANSIINIANKSSRKCRFDFNNDIYYRVKALEKEYLKIIGQ